MIKNHYKHIYLRPLEKRYLTQLKEWRNRQTNILRQYFYLTDFDQERWLAQLKGDRRQALFALLTKKNGRLVFIGYGGLTNLDLINRRGEISFVVDPRRAVRPAVYQKDWQAALYLFCAYGFEQLNLNRLFTDTFANRRQHTEILEKFGFRREGVLRQHYFKNGQYLNSFFHSILAPEWKKLYGNGTKK